jgi:hypothetical protein
MFEVDSAQWIGWLIGLLLFAIVVAFVLRFVLPSWRLGQRLERTIGALAALRPDPATRLVDLTPVGAVFAGGPLAHLWREYAQTLHATTDAVGGAPRIVAWRATEMAETHFTEQAIVDVPLQTEFYKHLPGILTGIGIIGTFSGLIFGLTHFEVTSDAQAVRDSLRLLIQGVGHAFRISAAAIALAMLFTWIEKSLVTARYRQVARLVEYIDSLFDAGVGEEYLARLVRAAEQNAEQAQQLKLALVGEFRQALGGLASQQQVAARQQQEELAAAVARSVGAALEAPMARVAAVLERSEAGQAARVGQALEQVLARFSADADRRLGQRQDELERTLAATAAALQATVVELRHVTGSLENAGRDSIDRVAGSLDSAGQGVGLAADVFGTASRELQAAATAIAAASVGASDLMRDHRDARDAFATMVADLRETVGLARREAALTGELVARMEAAAGSLGQAGERAGVYLDGVSQVLAEAHATFADQLGRTLREGNSQFQQELATAVDYLKGAIEELGDALETAVGRR